MAFQQKFFYQEKVFFKSSVFLINMLRIASLLFFLKENRFDITPDGKKIKNSLQRKDNITYDIITYFKFLIILCILRKRYLVEINDKSIFENIIYC